MVGLIGFAFCQSPPSTQTAQDGQGLQGNDRHCCSDPSPVGPLASPPLWLSDEGTQCRSQIVLQSRSSHIELHGIHRGWMPHPLHPGTQTLHVECVIRSGQGKHTQDHPAGRSLSSVFQFNPSWPENAGMRPQSQEARSGVTRKGSSPRTFQPTRQILPVFKFAHYGLHVAQFHSPAGLVHTMIADEHFIEARLAEFFKGRMNRIKVCLSVL